MLNTAYLISLIVFAILVFGLGIFTIIKNPKSLTSRLWFLVSVAAGFWAVSLFYNLTTDNAKEALFYAKALHFNSVFIAIFFYHFVISFIFKDKQNIQKLFLGFGYIGAISLALLSIFSNLIVVGVSPKFGFNSWVEAGSFYPIFLLFFWIYVMAAIYFLWESFSKSDGVMRKKSFYVLLAAVVGFLGQGTNFLPQTLGIYPYGSFVAWVYPILVTYGIFIEDIKIKIQT